MHVMKRQIVLHRTGRHWELLKQHVIVEYNEAHYGINVSKMSLCRFRHRFHAFCILPVYDVFVHVPLISGLSFGFQLFI